MFDTSFQGLESVKSCDCQNITFGEMIRSSTSIFNFKFMGYWELIKLTIALNRTFTKKQWVIQSYSPLSRLKGETKIILLLWISSVSPLSIFQPTVISTLYAFTHIKHTVLLLCSSPPARHTLPRQVYATNLITLRPTFQNCAFHLWEYPM